MKNRKTLSSWLTTKYLLVVRNEENFAEKSSFSFTYAKIIVISFLTLVICSAGSVLLYNNVLKSWFFSGETEFDINKKIVELSLAVDSLSNEVDKKEFFINTIQSVVSGDSVIGLSYERDTNNIFSNSESGSDASGRLIDSLLKDEFEIGKTSNINLVFRDQSSLQDMYFFPPVEGLVTRAYNTKIDHFGIDVVAKNNEPIKSIADGTVVLSSWTEDSGYVIALQHKSNVFSVYKHNSELLKKVGNFAQAGEIIAIIGNSGEITTGPHLHFEIWYNGNPVNPEEFVTFN
ncbi:M23 family metallopeptidase [Hyphobacterium sp. CCMP332]|nr:M23 family metallopeptidase [Hyphobacterium sp. CCMP332]